VLLQVPYDYLGAVVREVEAGGGETLDFHYGQDVSLEIVLPLQEMENLPGRIAAASRRQAVIKHVAARE
jgi:hypothetical protein